MRVREFGNTGRKVSEVGLGCWQLGGLCWGDVGEDKAFDILQAALDNGETLEGLGLVTTRHAPMTRDAFLPDLPQAALDAVFATAPGDHAVVTQDGVHILRTDEIVAVAPDAPEARAMRRELSAQLERAISDDLYAAFAAAMQAQAGISLKNAAIQAVHAQLR